MYCYNVGYISFLDQQLLNITEANKQKLTFKVAYKHIFISSAKNVPYFSLYAAVLRICSGDVYSILLCEQFSTHH